VDLLKRSWRAEARLPQACRVEAPLLGLELLARVLLPPVQDQRLLRRLRARRLRLVLE